jgi:non-ribosomal peptide synthetase component F
MTSLLQITSKIHDASARMEISFTKADIEQTVPARFEQAASHYPNHTALTDNGRSWTYAELNTQANRIAHAIRKQTQPDVGCVPYLLGHSAEMVIATLAVLKAGKTYLAIHPGMPASGQAAILRDAAPELILTSSAFESRVRNLVAETPSGSASILTMDQMDAGLHESNPTIEIKPHDPCTIFYTSGTTGLPKGVVKIIEPCCTEYGSARNTTTSNPGIGSLC